MTPTVSGSLSSSPFAINWTSSIFLHSLQSRTTATAVHRQRRNSCAPDPPCRRLKLPRSLVFPHRTTKLAHNVADHRHAAVARFVTVHSLSSLRRCSSSSSCQDSPLELALPQLVSRHSLPPRRQHTALLALSSRRNPPSSSYPCWCTTLSWSLSLCVVPIVKCSKLSQCSPNARQIKVEYKIYFCFIPLRRTLEF
jgi:hypothetical protein